jgi:hypothetical protein
MNYREFFAAVHKRPGMYGLDGTFTQFQIFLEGCDAATSWSLLAGFNEWLLMRLGRESNLSWSALVRWLAFPAYRQLITETLGDDADDSYVSERLVFPPGSSFNALSDDDNALAVETLFRLLDEFLELREQPRGLTKIFSEYVVWMEKHATKFSEENS